MILECKCTQCDCVISVELNPKHHRSTERVARVAIKEAAREHRRDTGHKTSDITVSP